MYPKNAWYVACTPDEIADKPLGRTICGEKIVFYRPAPDQVAALDDFCPHRGAPLSLGTVCEGHLQCGYHGLRVECTGKSVSMPGQRVQGFPKARSFPVVERMASSGCGLATPTRPTPPPSTTCPGPTTPSGPTAAGCTTLPATTA